MDFITHLKNGLLSVLPGLIEAYAGQVDAESLSVMERQIKQMTHELGNDLLQAWLTAQEPKYPADEQPCSCGETARYERRREGVAITLQGRVRYRRAYYRCACGRGQYPLDERLGIEPGQMSAEVVKVAALLGVQEAFGNSSATLAQTTLLELSPNSIRQACQQVGETVVAQEAALLERSQKLSAQLEQRRREDKPRCLYGSLDGFQVLFDDGWHEMKAGVWWTVDEKGQGRDIRYYVDSASAETFSSLVWAKGFEYGADQADQRVFIADGAHWIWRIVQQHFPQAIQIVDGYHACAYLVKVAHAAFGEGTTAAQDWLTQQRTNLWEGHLFSVVHACRLLVNKAPQAVAQARSYFAHNRTRLRYPRFRALGLQIGSGTRESGCKQIGLGRLKLAGARWSQDGARKLAKARAAFLTDQVNLLSLWLPQVA